LVSLHCTPFSTFGTGFSKRYLMSFRMRAFFPPPVTPPAVFVIFFFLKGVRTRVPFLKGLLWAIFALGWKRFWHVAGSPISSLLYSRHDFSKSLDSPSPRSKNFSLPQSHCLICALFFGFLTVSGFSLVVLPCPFPPIPLFF